MRILLVAYEFPPSPSPQSLRWAYLARKLQALGHDVHVLAPDLPGKGEGLPDIGGLVVHRVHAGPIVGFIAARSRKEALRAMDSRAANLALTGRPNRIGAMDADQRRVSLQQV